MDGNIVSEETFTSTDIDALVEATLNEAPRKTIPENSPTVLMSEDTIRFSSAEWYDKMQEKIVTIAGLGGIGSYVAFLIGRLKPAQIVLYDDDRVDSTNMSGQLYRKQEIGRYKIDATIENLRDFANYYSYMDGNGRFTEESVISSIAICGFDNMEARRIFFNTWKRELEERDKSNCLFIDGRLAAEEFQVFCFTGKDTYLMDKYEKEWLFSDKEAEETICSYKQTSFCANMIASIMVNLLVNFVTNQCNPLIQRELPFFTSYDASTLTFKTSL